MSTNVPRKVHYFLLKHRLLLLLFALLVLLVIFPFIYERFEGYMVIMEVMFSFVLLAGIYAVSPNRQLLTVVVLLGLLTLTVNWFNIYIMSSQLQLFGLSLEIIFFSITTATILSHVLQYKRVTADKIYGAICGYFLIGIVWALIYSVVEHAAPGSFNFSTELASNATKPFTHPFYFNHFIYFSFVTLTTLGYGDITPITAPAKALSSLEAMMGQLYVAVLIARLVGLQIIHAHLAALDKK